MRKFHALVDTDAFVSWMLPDDVNHKKVAAIFDEMQKKQLALATTSLVVAETATVLSSRVEHVFARKFIYTVKKFPVFPLMEEFEQKALEIFGNLQGRHISVVDCANVAIMQRYNIPTIFSFNPFYTEKFGLKLTTQSNEGRKVEKPVVEPDSS